MSTDALPRIVLKPGRHTPVRGRHPWLHDSAVGRVENGPADGDEVDVCSSDGRWLARGLYNSHSRIRVRLYTWNSEERIDDAFWRRRLEAAADLRLGLGYDTPAGAARLVYSEGDGLSGLIIDRYAGHLVVQPTALALSRRMDSLVPLLQEIWSPESITLRADQAMLRREGYEAVEGPIVGTPPEVVFIEEHGVKYGVPLAGQKTGWYLDQRENRLAAAHWLRGRRVLDVCCYGGGFALAAVMVGGATEVLGVDTSAAAVALARANAELSSAHQATFEIGDCFDDLAMRLKRGERYGGVVLDPPKFSRGRGGVATALRAYHHLNQLAVQLLEPGGILVTCSCSGSVRREDFFATLQGVAVKTGRELQLLEQRGASPDHPIPATCAETEYLKCFVCRVL